MRREGGGEAMVVLLLAPGAFDVFAGEEPGLLVQIDIFPFSLQQLTNPALRAQADPERESVSFFNGRMPSYFWPAGRAL